MFSQSDLRLGMRKLQRCLAAGNDLPSITAVAQRAGIHRDTIYALLAGDRISARSQYALSRVIGAVELEMARNAGTKVMTISLGLDGPKLGFGVRLMPLLRSTAFTKR
jgi:hypothetical protein